MNVKQLFCKHKYKFLGTFGCTYLPDNNEEELPVEITFFECVKCGKRKLTKYHNCFYGDNLLQQLRLWLKGELDFKFQNNRVFYNLHEGTDEDGN